MIGPYILTNKNCDPCEDCDPTCIANFTFAEDGDDECLFQFTDTSTPSTGASLITSWDWDFGDGFGSTEQNPEHAFSEGTHNVTLTVTDDLERECSITKPVTCTPTISDCTCGPAANPEELGATALAWLPSAAPDGITFTRCNNATGWYGLDSPFDGTPCAWGFFEEFAKESPPGDFGCVGGSSAATWNFTVVLRFVAPGSDLILQLEAYWTREFVDEVACMTGRGRWEKNLGPDLPGNKPSCKGTHSLTRVLAGDDLCEWTATDAIVVIP